MMRIGPAMSRARTTARTSLATYRRVLLRRLIPWRRVANVGYAMVVCGQDVGIDAVARLVVYLSARKRRLRSLRSTIKSRPRDRVFNNRAAHRTRTAALDFIIPPGGNYIVYAS